MNGLMLMTGFLSLFLLGRHVYCAYRLESSMKREDMELWQAQGRPKPIAFFYSDLKRFKLKNMEFIDGNAAVRRSVARYERSWKYGMPMILLLFITAQVLQRLPFIS